MRTPSPQALLSRCFWLVACTVLVLQAAQACPFCNPTSSDYINVAQNSLAVAKVEKLENSKYKITETLKGSVKVGRVVLAGDSRDNSPKESPVYIVSTISNPNQPYWSEPVQRVSAYEYDFLKKSLKAKTNAERYNLAAANLEHSSEMVAESSYNILAPAPVAEVQKRAGLVGQKKLIQWILDSRIPSERKPLYIFMALPKLNSQDELWLRRSLFEPPMNAYANHLPTLMIAYAEVGGPTAIKEMEKQFLKPSTTASASFGPSSGFAYIGTHSAKPEVRKAAREVFRRELQVPERAVFAISHLGEWRDYQPASQIEDLAYQNGETPWVVSSVTRYFRSFNKPEAKQALARLRTKYPKLVDSSTKPFAPK